MIDFKRMENIHLSDEQLYDLIKQNFRDGYYESAINLMETNPQLDEKILGQIAYNSMQNNLKHLQEQNDPDFKKDLIPLSYDKPKDLPINKIWFKITKEEKAVVEKTYAELLTLKQNNQLEVGNIYLLKDYVTKYQQPVSLTMKVGKYDLATATPSQIQEETEPLLLQAISKNEFAVECYSPLFPDDIVYYDFDSNICEDNLTPRNGFITRRYDTVNKNNCPDDWRHIVWARWKPNNTQYYLDGVLTNYSVWASGSAIEGVLYKAGNQLLMAQNTNVPTTATDSNVFYVIYENTDWALLTKDKTKIANKIELAKGDFAELKTFGENCKFNAIGEAKLHNNVFISSCNYNSFGNSCYYNSFGNSCDSNSFGNSCYYNSFGNSCDSNSFGNSCYSNSFGNSCDSNSFGNSCDSNSFGNSCYYNSFGNGCYYNSFGNGCYYNSFGNNCDSNSFGNSCDSNSFGNSCDSNSFGRLCSSIYIAPSCGGIIFGDYKTRLFIKQLNSKNIANISDLQSKAYTITIEQMSSGSYCYWYKIGTSYTNITTVEIP